VFYALALVCAIAAFYQLLAIVAALDHRRRRPRSSAPEGVSILKPIRGADPGFYDAIRSHAVQNYPEFEILFGLRDPADAARPDIERLIAEFPSVAIRLIVCTQDAPNAKVGTLMPREEHNEILRTALSEIPNRPGRRQDRVRVVFEGGFCEQPPLDMLQLIEEACYIVDDDLLIGMRWIVDDVAETGDPLQALAESYLEHSTYSPVQHDDRKPKEEMLLRRFEEASAQAVILAAAKMCEPGLDEQVAYQKTLEQKKIPFLLLDFEEKMTAFERMRMEVETFVESILFD